eukprot:g4968.t1
MFSCGIGHLSKKFLSRRKRRSSVTLPIVDESLPSYHSDVDSISFSCCSSESEYAGDRLDWNTTDQDSIKRGYCVKTRHTTKPIQVDPQDVQFGDTLGRGVSGTVYKGRVDHQDVAIKKIRPEMKENGLPHHSEPFELRMGQNLNHPNLVKILGVHINSREHNSSLNSITDWDDLERENDVEGTPHGVRRSSSSLFSDMAQDLSEMFPEEIWIIMEYCDQGSLREAINRGEFFEDEDWKRSRILHILLTALEVAVALDHLHSYGIIHGDLKSQNVLLMSSEIVAKNFICKVGDFGMSRPFTQIKTHISTFTAGTISHMPPEVLRDGILTPATDVFSFGMILWELMAGKVPFLGMNSGEIMVAIVEGQRPEIPSDWPPMYSKLIHSCWSARRDQRPTFKTVIKHIKRMLGGPTLEEARFLPVLNTHTTTTTSGLPTCSSDFFSSEESRISYLDTNADLNELPVSSTTKKETPDPDLRKEDSQIPKPPRISVITEVTSKTKPICSAKRKPFPQWQAYLDAINVSENTSTKWRATKIPEFRRQGPEPRPQR